MYEIIKIFIHRKTLLLFAYLLYSPLLLSSEATHDFEIKYYPYIEGIDGPDIQLRGSFKVWTLMGEPVKTVHVQWKSAELMLLSNIAYGPHKSGCQALPQSVIDDIPITLLKLRAQLITEGGPFYIVFDADRMKKSGGPNEYGERNFTSPASPSWGGLIQTDLSGKNFIDASRAKSIFKAGLRFTPPTVHDIAFDLNPVKKWIEECKKRQKKDSKQGSEQALIKLKQRNQSEIEHEGSSVINSFEEQLRVLEESDEKLAIEEATIYSSRFHEQLAAIPDMWAKQEREEKKLIDRQKEIEKKKILEAQEKEQQIRTAEKNHFSLNKLPRCKEKIHRCQKLCNKQFKGNTAQQCADDCNFLKDQGRSGFEYSLRNHYKCRL